MDPLRVAVIGAGAFGQNHLRVYRELEQSGPIPASLAACVDPNSATRAAVAAKYGIPVFATLPDLLGSGMALSAASICVPTLHHAAVAEQLLHAGLDVLIEKPFAATLPEAKSILALAESLGRIIQVGHLERFNPAVTALTERIRQPMFFECHRLSIFTPRALDVDVVLDLMIHDLDIVLSLVKCEAREVRAVGLPVLSGKVDIANARVEFESGCIANFTASRISTERVRKLRLFQQRQYLSLDFARQELFAIDVTPEAARHMAAASALPPAGLPAMLPGEHPSAGLSLHKFELPLAEPLRLELQDFLYSVQHHTSPRVSGRAGCDALALALAINEEIATHAKRAGL